MDQQQLEQILNKTFEDFRLSKSEKSALQQVLADYQTDIETLNFVRNRAFEIVRNHHRSSTQYLQESLKWLEHVIRILDSLKTNGKKQDVAAYFSPGNECLNKIKLLLKQARTSIDVCVFTISDNEISAALIAAHQRAIDVRVITDNDKIDDQGSDIYELVRQGIKVKIDTSPNHMHHKFAVFDNDILVNGSFNWTRSASRYNRENIVVSNLSELTRRFKHLFEVTWEACVWL